jgi:predicted porin
LYGLVNDGLSYVKNSGGSHLFSMMDGEIQPSRFGITGVENLGGGTSAIFTLENGITLNTGATTQAGLIFGRQALVGLKSDSLGTLSFGRQYEFFWDNLTALSLGSTVGQFAWHPGDYDHLAGTLRVNNSVKWTGPSFRGLTLGGMYGFTDRSSATGDGRLYSFGAKYVNGGLTVAAAYTDTNSVALNPLVQSGAPLYAGAPPGPVIAQGVRNIGAGGNYTIGAFSTRLLYTNTQIITARGGVTSATYEASEVFRITPATFVGAGFWYSKLGPTQLRNASAIIDYLLSKRTDIYLTASFLHASGQGVPAFLGVAAPSVGTRSNVAAQVGMRTFF